MKKKWPFQLSQHLQALPTSPPSKKNTCALDWLVFVQKRASRTLSSSTQVGPSYDRKVKCSISRNSHKRDPLNCGCAVFSLCSYLVPVSLLHLMDFFFLFSCHKWMAALHPDLSYEVKLRHWHEAKAIASCLGLYPTVKESIWLALI